MDAREAWGTSRTAGTSNALATVEERRARRTSFVIGLTIVTMVVLLFALPFILYACGAFDVVEGALAGVPR